ncbi:MAG: hypothetical protein AB3N64_04255 [Puniceicoccaceae bacterium]
MKQQNTAYPVQLTFTAEEWDALRESLKDSEMADINLCTLAKNLDRKWPIRGEEETPARYLDYSLEALKQLPEFYGKDSRLPLLYNILLETKQFDDPYAEMVQLFDDYSDEVQKPKTPLELLEVPVDMPVELMTFSRETLDSCRQGKHNTISELIAFLEKSKTATTLNEEYRELMRAYNNFDQVALSKLLPIRDGSKGIFLAEAIGHMASKLTDQQAATLIYAFNVKCNKEAWGDSYVLPKAGALSLINQVKEKVLKGFEQMPDQAQELRAAIESGLNSSVRFFVSLDDPELEALALAVALAALPGKPRFKGFMGSFLN